MSDQSVAAIDRIFEWDDSQNRAIARCCDMQQRIVPVTGVAGTGKTTLMREVYNALSDAGYRIALCAPTGKAAKRIQEATGLPAMTIHRLLEYPHPGERDETTGKPLESTDPKRHRGNPLTYQVILADEYPMVNHEVHRNLIDALPSSGRICMFGDVNQLAPIEPPSVKYNESPFQAAIRKFDGVVLEYIHRQQEGSGVAFNGERILNGRMPQRTDDFIIRITDNPIRLLEQIVMRQINKGINYGTNDGQIIAPSKKGWTGAYKLNVALQDLLNPIGNAARVRIPRHKWDDKQPITLGIGDKIIWTENSYDLRNPWERYIDDNPEMGYIPTPPEKMIMNGESGVVTMIDSDGNLTIDIGDRTVEIPYTLQVETRRGMGRIDPRTKLDLGFCITTHKAQGSEWPHVIYVLNKSNFYMQSRRNLYTGISRARITATIVTDQRSLQTSVTTVVPAIDKKDKTR